MIFQASILTKTHGCAPIVQLSQFSSLYNVHLVFRQGVSEVSLHLFPGKPLLLRTRLTHYISFTFFQLVFPYFLLIFFLTELLNSILKAFHQTALVAATTKSHVVEISPFHSTILCLLFFL